MTSFMPGKNITGSGLARSAVWAGVPASPSAAAAIMLAVAGSTTMPSERRASSVGFSAGSPLANVSSASQATSCRGTNRR
jgi:hypothetical protein